MSFIPSRGVESSFHALVPPPHDSCHRITSRFLCAIAAVITPPFSSLSRAFVRSSPYHSRAVPTVSFLLPLTRDEEEILSGSPTWPPRSAYNFRWRKEGGEGRAREGTTVDMTVVAGRNLSTHNAEIRAIRATSRFELIFIFNGRINGTGLLASLAANRFFANPCGIAASLEIKSRVRDIISKGRFFPIRLFISFLLLSWLLFQINVYMNIYIYIFWNICPPSLVKFRLERYIWW